MINHETTRWCTKEHHRGRILAYSGAAVHDAGCCHAVPQWYRDERWPPYSGARSHENHQPLQHDALRCTVDCWWYWNLENTSRTSGLHHRLPMLARTDYQRKAFPPLRPHQLGAITRRQLLISLLHLLLTNFKYVRVLRLRDHWGWYFRSRFGPPSLRDLGLPSFGPRSWE